MSTDVSYSNVLKDIEDFYVETSVDAYAPTLNKKFKFKPLSVSQMKRFIELQVKAAKDELGIITSLDMVNDLNNCLVENYIGSDGKELLDQLTILDRDNIVAQLRASNSGTLDIPSQTEEDEAETVDISHLLTNKNKKLPADCKKHEKVFKFKTGHIKLKLRLPTLQLDTLINSYFKAQVGPYLRQGAKKFQGHVEKILSQTYFVELCKYIEVLEIEKDSKSTTITFDNLHTLTNQLIFLEDLPSNIVIEINNYIKKIKEYKDETIYYVDSNGKHKPLTVDVNLFTSI